MNLQHQQSQVTAEIQEVAQNLVSSQYQTAAQIEAHQRGLQQRHEQQLVVQHVASQAASHSAQAVQVSSAVAASATAAGPSASISSLPAADTDMSAEDSEST